MNEEQKARFLDMFFDAFGIVFIVLAGYLGTIGELPFGKWINPFLGACLIIMGYVLVKSTVEPSNKKEPTE
jgi:hypothetical protein